MKFVFVLRVFSASVCTFKPFELEHAEMDGVKAILFIFCVTDKPTSWKRGILLIALCSSDSRSGNFLKYGQCFIKPALNTDRDFFLRRCTLQLLQD